MGHNRIRWLWAFALVVPLLATCSPRATPVPPTPTFWPTAVVPVKPAYTVERGTVVDSLVFTGRVAPVSEEELYFRTDGRVKEVYVERGDVVQEGQRLAELDVEALYRQLERAGLDLETAQTDLTGAQADLAHDLARARLDLELAQISLDKLQAYDAGADLAVARLDLEAARVVLQEAQAKYDRVAYSPDIAMRPEARALQEATLALERAEATYEQAERAADQDRYDAESQRKRVELAGLEVARLEAGVDLRLAQAVARAKLELADLQAQITDTLILAPFDGEIAALSTAGGKAVEGFKPVMVLADPSELEVTAELPADEMQDLSEGQPVTVIPVEYPGQDLPGAIRQLPYPYGSGGSSTGLEDEDRNTHISVDFAQVAVEAGDLVRVTVVLEQKDDVLWLPPAAIRTFEGRKFVVIQEGAAQRQVDVSLGIESDDRVEIKEGLKEGDVVMGY